MTKTDNDKQLKQKSPVKKACAIFFECVLIVFIIISGLVCFSSINSRVQKTCPTFIGYSNMIIASESMTNSGLNVGDRVVTKAVDAKTIKEGDIIAFYVYSPDYVDFNLENATRIDNQTIDKTRFVHTFVSLFGVQTKEITNAAKSGATLVIHHVREVYEDENGMRWFKTYGSSNESDDSWFISEKMIVGLYSNDSFALFVSKTITLFSSTIGIIVIIGLVLMLASLIIVENVKVVKNAKNEIKTAKEAQKTQKEQEKV